MATGKKTGGRKAGSKNKRTIEQKELLERLFLEKGNKTPLELFVEFSNDELNDKALRNDAAKAAAPYIHAKVATKLELSGPEGGPVEVDLVTKLEAARKRALTTPRSGAPTED